MFTLPVKVSACFRSSSSVWNTIMSMKSRLPPNKFAMRQVFRLGRRRRRSELELQDGRIVKKGGAQEIQHPTFVSGHDRVAGGVWYGEVHVVIRVRTTERMSPSISPNSQHPSIMEEPGFLITGVSHHLRKFPTRRFPQRSFCISLEHLIHHLQSPRGTVGLPSVGPVPGGVADAGKCSNHWASTAGSSSTPRGTLRATIRRRIESRSRFVAASSLREETFQRHHLRLDTP